MSAPIYTVTYEYNGDANLWKVHQDPSGLNRTTTFTYTTFGGIEDTETGLLASISDPLGHTVSYAYGMPDGDFTSTVWVVEVDEPASGGTEVWSIAPYIAGEEPWPFTAFASNNDGLSVHIAMDDYLRTAFWDVGNEPPYKFSYDSQNNVVETINSSFIWGPDDYYHSVPNIQQFSTFGPHGNELTHSFAVGYSGASAILGNTTTTTWYDGSKYFQKASVTDPNSHTTTMDYFGDDDASVGNRGEAKWIRDARYGTTAAEFDYTYNTYGQKATEVNLNNVETDYTYGDAWGNLTEVVQDSGGMGHLNCTTDMTYDVAGRVTASTDPMSQSSSFTFNGVGQPLVATLPDETVSYGYGANGRKESVTDGRGTTYIGYETGNDRVASVTDPVTGVINYTYGLSGERLTIALPGGDTWHYAYSGGGPGTPQQIAPKDDLNSVSFMLRKITDDQGRVVNYYMDQFGRLSEARVDQSFDGGGSLVGYVDTTYQYDFASGTTLGHGWLAEISNTWHHHDMMGWHSSVLSQNDYSYDPAGNRSENDVSDSGGLIRAELYDYDELNHLTSVDYGDGETQSYTFDPMGNRLSKSDTTTSTVTESYSYNNANMLLSRGSNSYTNDADGNTLTGGGRSNTWNGENRLTACAYSGNSSSYVYGCDGLRRQSTVNGTTSNFAMDCDSVVRSQVAGEDGVQKTWLHGARGPEYERSGSGDPVWYLYDGLGSVVGTANGSGSLISGRSYDVYGAVRSLTGGSGPAHKWNGQLGHSSEDESGLTYMRARYFDPNTGRFESEDPSGRESNLLAYARSNPTTRTDRDGRLSAEAWQADPIVYSVLFTAMAVSALSLKDWADAMRCANIAISICAFALIGPNAMSRKEDIGITVAAFLGGGAMKGLIETLKMGTLGEGTWASIAVMSAVAYSVMVYAAVAGTDPVELK